MLCPFSQELLHPCVPLPIAPVSSPIITLPMLILATGYIPFPSPLSASQPKVGEEGECYSPSQVLSWPPMAHWPFACSTAEVNGVQDITIFFLFDKEARKNICFSSAQGCLLFHSFNIFFNDYTGFNQTCQWDSCEDNYLPTKVIPVPYSLTGDGSDCTSNVCKISYSVRFL